MILGKSSTTTTEGFSTFHCHVWFPVGIWNNYIQAGSSDLFPVASFCTVSHCNFKKPCVCVSWGMAVHFASSTSFNRCIDPPSTSKKTHVICFGLCKLKFPWLQKYSKVASNHKICISINSGPIWPNWHLRQENALACFNTTWPELEVHQDSQVHLLGESWQMGRSQSIKSVPPGTMASDRFGLLENHRLTELPFFPWVWLPMITRGYHTQHDVGHGIDHLKTNSGTHKKGDGRYSSINRHRYSWVTHSQPGCRAPVLRLSRPKPMGFPPKINIQFVV